nr:MAG TPA: hypothetical protein [Caudoviricetes sp.]DAY79652.1 MAG TPA: hypothetical protein [Caudoviricetes sp.]
MEQRKVERLLLQIQKNQLDQQWKDFLHRLFYPPAAKTYSSAGHKQTTQQTCQFFKHERNLSV